MGKGGGSAKMQVVEYRMSIHYGIGGGPVDAIRKITVGEKTAWVGNMTAPGQGTIYKPNLFGGEQKEGGLEGNFYFLPGRDDQVLPSGLAARLGLSPTQAPGYRGVASIWFYGQLGGSNVNNSLDLDQDLGYTGLGEIVGGLVRDVQRSAARFGGFLWGKNQPFIQDTWITVDRAPKGLALTSATIGSQGDANPAHLIYECLTNVDWGMGAQPALIDADDLNSSFGVAAQQLLDEGFGLSLLWTRQSEIEDFVQEILDHIQATLYVDPTTGRYTLKLLRDDYDPNTVPELDMSNVRVRSFQRKGWGEITNEITVTYSNPDNEDDETVTVQNLAAIEAQGDVSSGSRDFYGIRNLQLARDVAERELRQSSTPLAIAEVEVEAGNVDLFPGAVVRLNWPRHQANGVIFRVMGMEEEEKSSKVRVSLMEDVFSLTKALVPAGQASQWESPDLDPVLLEQEKVFTLPYAMTARLGIGGTEDGLLYPEAVTGLLGFHPSGDVVSVDPLTEVTTPDGNVYLDEIRSRRVAGYAQLTAAIPAEARTVYTERPNIDTNRGPVETGFVMIGGGSEQESELALIEKNPNGDGFQFVRGIYDTVPKAWPAGTPLWFFILPSEIADVSRVRGAGEVAAYRLRARTSQGVMDHSLIPEIQHTVTERPHRPARPADVKIDGVGFGAVDLTSKSEIAVTWSRRNRLAEDAAPLAWDDADQVPEVNQTTNVRATDTLGNEIALWLDVPGTRKVINTSEFAGEDLVYLEVFSSRDDIASMTAHGIWLTQNGATPPNNPPPGIGDYDTPLPGTGPIVNGGTPEPGRNMVPDPYFQRADVWGFGAGPWYSVSRNGSDYPTQFGAPKAALISEEWWTGSSSAALQTAIISGLMGPGSGFVFSADGENNGSGSATISVELTWHRSDTGAQVGAAETLTWAKGESGRKAIQVAAPAGADSRRYRVYTQGGVNWSGDGVVTNVSMDFSHLVRDENPPEDPTGFSASPRFTGALLTWSNPVDPDLSHVEIWSHTSSVLGNASHVNTAQVPSETITHTGQDAGTTYFYWIRAVDRWGYKSGFVGPQSVTTNLLTPDDMSFPNGSLPANVLQPGIVFSQLDLQSGDIPYDLLNIPAGSIQLQQLSNSIQSELARVVEIGKAVVAPGVNAGAQGDMKFHPNVHGGSPNIGEIWITDLQDGSGSHFNHPTLGRIDFPGTVTLNTPWESSIHPYGGRFYVMYLGSRTTSDIGVTGANQTNLVTATYNDETETWTAYGNGGGTVFSPDPTDVVLAIGEKEQGATQITSLRSLVGNETPVLQRVSGIETEIGDDTTGGTIKGRIRGTETILVGVDGISGLVKDVNDITLEIGDDGTPGSLRGRITDTETILSTDDGTGIGLVQRVQNAFLEIGTDGSAGTIKGRIKTQEDIVGDSNGGLVKRTSDLELEVGDDGSPLTVKGRISAQELIVGDANGGLVKQTNDLSLVVQGPSGTGGLVGAISDVNALLLTDDQQGGGIGVIQRARNAELAIGSEANSSTILGRIKNTEDILLVDDGQGGGKSLIQRASDLDSQINTPTTGLSARLGVTEQAINDNTNPSSLVSVASRLSETETNVSVADEAIFLGTRDPYFEQGGRYFTRNGFNDAPGDPVSLRDVDDMSGFTAVVSDRGPAMETTGYNYAVPKWAYRMEPGKRYRARALIRCTSNPTNGNPNLIRIGLPGWSEDFATYSGYVNSTATMAANLSVADGWQQVVYEWDGDTALANGGVYVRPFILVNGSSSASANSTTQLAHFGEVQDITDSFTTNARTAILEESLFDGAETRARLMFLAESNGRIASGWLTSSTTPQGQTTTQIGFDADVFGIWNGSAPVPAFQVADNNVFLRGDLIANGSLTGEKVNAASAINVGTGNALTGGLYDRAGMWGHGTNSNPIRFFAGHVDPNTAPYQVFQDGRIVARRMTILTADGGAVWFDTETGYSELARAQILAQTSPRTSFLAEQVASNTATTSFTLVETVNVTTRVRVSTSGMSVWVPWSYGSPKPTVNFPNTLTVQVQTRPQGGSWTTRVTQSFTKITSGTPNSTQYLVSEFEQEPYQEYEPGFGGQSQFEIPGFVSASITQPAQFIAEAVNSFAGDADGETYEVRALLTPTGGDLSFDTRSRTLEMTTPADNLVLDVSATQGEGNANTLDGLDSSEFARTIHAHSADQITSGVLNSARIPNLAASKITSGVFGTSRIPNLDASKIASGFFNPLRVRQSHIFDSRNDTIVSPTPGELGSTTQRTDFRQSDSGRGGQWSSVVSVKGWSGSYAAHQLSFNAHNSISDGNLYHRTGRDATWQAWRQIWDSGNLDPNDADNLTTGTVADARLPALVTGMTDLRFTNASDREKLRVYGSGPYAIGMQSGVTYGHLSDWAMTFQFNNETDRGFWWGHDGHTQAQGAMSLTTDGRLWVGQSVHIAGQLAATQSWVNSQNFTVDGVQRNDTFTSSVNWDIQGTDFVVRDSTDPTTNYIWRDHSASALYLGTSAAIPTFRANPSLNGYSLVGGNGNIYDVNYATFGNGLSTLNTAAPVYVDFNQAENVDTTRAGIFVRMDSTGDVTNLTTDRIRAAVYGASYINDNSTTANSHVQLPYGGYFVADVFAGHADNIFGVYAIGAVSGGSDSDGANVYGGSFEARLDNPGSTAGSLHGLMGTVRIVADADDSVTANAVRGVFNIDGATVGTGRMFYGTVDAEVGSTISTLYGLHLDLQNNYGGTITTRRGIWVEGNASYVSNSIGGRTYFGDAEGFINPASDWQVHIDDNKSTGAGLLVTGGGGGAALARFARDVGADGAVEINVSSSHPQIGFDWGGSGVKNVSSGIVSTSEYRITFAGAVTEATHFQFINSSGDARLAMNGKTAFRGGDNWLRINDLGGFTSGVYFGNSVVRTDGHFAINGGNTSLRNGGSGSLRVQTASGYVDVGPQNTSFCHFSTDRATFYFNKPISVDGDLRFYDAASKIDFGSRTTEKDLAVMEGRTVLRQMSDRGALLLRSADDSLNLYAGDNHANMTDNVGLTGEDVHIGAEGQVEFYTNLQNGWASRGYMTFSAAGDLTVSGNVSQLSDRSKKKSVTKMARRDLSAFRAVDFVWKKSGRRDFGLIAQEVQEFAPEVVVRDDLGILSVDYARLSVISLDETQHLKAELEDERRERRRLAKRVKELEAVVF